MTNTYCTCAKACHSQRRVAGVGGFVQDGLAAHRRFAGAASAAGASDASCTPLRARSLAGAQAVRPHAPRAAQATAHRRVHRHGGARQAIVGSVRWAASGKKTRGMWSQPPPRIAWWRGRAPGVSASDTTEQRVTAGLVQRRRRGKGAPQNKGSLVRFPSPESPLVRPINGGVPKAGPPGSRPRGRGAAAARHAGVHEWAPPRQGGPATGSAQRPGAVHAGLAGEARAAGTRRCPLERRADPG